MVKRLLIIISAALVIALTCVGVAAATGGVGPADDEGTTSVSLTETSFSTSPTTAGSGESGADETTSTTAGLEEPDGDDDGVCEDDGGPTEDDGDEDSDLGKGDSPDNFGQTIASLRAAGDHTPAAVIKGKKVPGYYKKISGGGTTTTTVVTDD